MPLTMVSEGAECIVNRIVGRDDVQRHIENLGIIPGTVVKVVSRSASGLIINVKESRVAIGRELACKVFV